MSCIRVPLSNDMNGLKAICSSAQSVVARQPSKIFFASTGRPSSATQEPVPPLGYAGVAGRCSNLAGNLALGPSGQRRHRVRPIGCWKGLEAKVQLPRHSKSSLRCAKSLTDLMMPRFCAVRPRSFTSSTLSIEEDPDRL